MIQVRDVMVPMRDGVHLCIDIYRPDAEGKFPALLAIARHNKDLQPPDVAGVIPPQPAWSTLWSGSLEAGDTRYLVSRGYAHVIGNVRGSGKSEDGGSDAWDYYDLIEWIARQAWCDGNIGLIGISAFGQAQFRAAIQQPPHLKAIFPFDPMGAYGEIRDRFPGGMLHVMLYILEQLSIVHGVKDRPGTLSPERERLWKKAMNNPDYKMYVHLYNVLTQKGQHMPAIFNFLLDPFDTEESVKKTEEDFGKIRVPTYTGSGGMLLVINHIYRGRNTGTAE